MTLTNLYHCDKCGKQWEGPEQIETDAQNGADILCSNCRTHYHYGAGLHGYLYQDGPHYAESYQDAVNALAESYSLGRTRKASLKKNGYLELNLKRDGNEYCEISKCSDNCNESDYE